VAGERRSQVARSAASRRLLLECARRRFAADGYQATSVDAICAEVNLSKGGFYHHFGDKAELFQAVLEDIQRSMRRRVARAVRSAASPYDRLVRGCAAFVEASADPGANRILFVDGPAVIGSAAWRELDRSYWHGDLRDLLEAARADGSLKAVPLEAMADLIAGMLTEAAQLADRGAPDSARRAEVVEAVTILLSGLRAGG
jgi:AcrR family transcriptional regulator